MKRTESHVLRPFGGPSDLRALARVHVGRAQRDEVDPHSVQEKIPNSEEIAREIATLDDRARDVRLAELNGGVVGYSAVRWWVEKGGAMVYLHRGYVLPEHRGKGIGTALLNWAEGLIVDRVSQHGPTANAVFGANASSTERDATQLLRHAGYMPAMTVVEMGIDDIRKLRSTTAPEVPSGFLIRSPGSDDYRAMWDVLFESYAHWPAFIGVPTEDAFQEFASSLAPHCCRIAESDGEIVAMTVGIPRQPYGEIKDLSVLASYRRRGLGRALLLSVIGSLRDAGSIGVRLATSVNNPDQSYALYEGVGFRRLKEFVRYRKPVTS